MMTRIPFRCPKCSTFVRFTYFDTAGQHWICQKCGYNSESYTITYDTKIDVGKNQNENKDSVTYKIGVNNGISIL